MANPQAPRTSVLSGKYLTFFLGEEEYGIEILKTQEIISPLRITPVPNAPAHVLGVINLRGKVIPVVDLKARLGMGSVGTGKQCCIIVVRAAGQQVGALVDRVSAVSDIREQEIDPTPALATNAAAEFLLGIAKSDSKVRLLLDIERAVGTTALNARNDPPPSARAA